MIYQRGTKQSYKKWAEAVGDNSYTWDSFLPYFKKSVSFTPPNTVKRFANATASYDVSAFSKSNGGPLQVSYANYAQPFSTWMEPALHEAGVPPTLDFNSGSLMGSQYCSSTIRPDTQTRDSSQTSFLHEAAGRKNLKVYTLTLAKKIIFEIIKDSHERKRATAVVVETKPFGPLFQFKLKARKEVIISAGAFQSPQLLMVSGIGPKAELEKHKIPVVVDRPGVGQGMQDHVFFGPTWRVKVQTLTRAANDLLWLAKEFLGPYSIKKEGLLTNPVCDYLGWEKTPRHLVSKKAAQVLDKKFPADWPEIEYLSAPGYVGDFGNLLKSQPKDGYMYATILGGLVAPLSRGTVTLKSGDTKDLPIINPNWLTDPVDVEVAIAIYKRLREVFKAKAFKHVLIGADEYFPGYKADTDAEILSVIKKTVMTIWHASCTCKMGKADDPLAVVDKDAKVFGVEGLRVVDVSSFALLPPGHPQSTVYALAEKIAAEILKKW